MKNLQSMFRGVLPPIGPHLALALRCMWVLVCCLAVWIWLVSMHSPQDFPHEHFEHEVSWSSQTGIPLLDILVHQDALHYLKIAEHGYAKGYVPDAGNSVVFFPLLPAMMATLHAVFGLPFVYAGHLISLVCFGLALFLTVKVGQLYLPERAQDDRWSWILILSLVLHPQAFIFSLVYTESLFLCLVLLFLWAWKQQAKPLLIVSTALLCLARPPGLAIPWLIALLALTGSVRELWGQWVARTSLKGVKAWIWPSLARHMFAPRVLATGLGAVLGAGTLMAIYSVSVGDPLAFINNRVYWDGAEPGLKGLQRMVLPEVMPRSLLPYSLNYFLWFGLWSLWVHTRGGNRGGDKGHSDNPRSDRGSSEVVLLSVAAVLLFLPYYQNSMSNLVRYPMVVPIVFAEALYRTLRWSPRVFYALSLALVAVQTAQLLRWVRHMWVS